MVLENRLAVEALNLGFPRLVVSDARPRRLVPIMEVDQGTLGCWEADRRSRELFPARLDYISDRLRDGLGLCLAIDCGGPCSRRFVSRCRSKASAIPAPPFGHRVLEFPIR